MKLLHLTLKKAERSSMLHIVFLLVTHREEGYKKRVFYLLKALRRIYLGGMIRSALAVRILSSIKALLKLYVASYFKADRIILLLKSLRKDNRTSHVIRRCLGGTVPNIARLAV